MADEELPDKNEFDFWEQVAGRSPGRMSFSMTDSRASLPYFLNPERITIEEAVPQILGTCTRNGRGGLSRTLPKSHPRLPFLFAHAITDLVGLGRATYQAAETDDLEAPAIVAGYAEYPRYLAMVDFSQRPYAVLSDESVGEPYTIEWTTEGGVPATNQVVDEYLRYTDYDIAPMLEVASAQHGQMAFRTQAGGGPDGIPFSGFPRIAIPRAVIKFRWYEVPFDYIDDENSYLTDHIGKVNQLDWYGFPAGSLLYSGCTVSRRYTPPFPEKTAWYGSVAYSTAKLCDVELLFEYTRREAGLTPPTPESENWVAAGWNLQPWLTTRKFYYATSEDPDDREDEEAWVPTYLSVPFQLLFTDPDI